MRIYAVKPRAYVTPAGLAKAVEFYEGVLDRSGVRHSVPHLGIEFVTIGDVQIIAAAKELLSLFSQVTAVAFVDSVKGCEPELRRRGAEIMQPPEQGPFGPFMLVRHPDGMIVEYSEQSLPQ